MKAQHLLNGNSIILPAIAGLTILFSTSCVRAQDVPADLLNLSLEELFAADIAEDSSDVRTSSNSWRSRWRFQLTYQRSNFDGYNNGTDELALDEVLFSPGTEARTEDNFPVVPTVICQDVQAFVASYEFNRSFAMQLAIPYVNQSSEHISVVPGYDEFVIESSGVGDITLLGSYKFSSDPINNWLISIGLSLPTGSIDKRGDTPRSPGNQLIPYSMQIGSGTYDLPVSVGYSHNGGKLSWGGSLDARLRLGENDHDYRLGNRIAVSSWLRWNSLDWVKPSLKLSYEYTGRIDGLDRELLVPAAFPFPAPVTNPDFYGGKQANLSLGFSFPAGAGKTVEAEISRPVYQSLNGPQVREDIHFGLRFNF